MELQGLQVEEVPQLWGDATRQIVVGEGDELDPHGSSVTCDTGPDALRARQGEPIPRQWRGLPSAVVGPVIPIGIVIESNQSRSVGGPRLDCREGTRRLSTCGNAPFGFR